MTRTQYMEDVESLYLLCRGVSRLLLGYLEVGGRKEPVGNMSPPRGYSWPCICPCQTVPALSKLAFMLGLSCSSNAVMCPW